MKSVKDASSFFLDAGFLMFGQVYGVKVTRLSWVVFLTFPGLFREIRLLQEKSREDFYGKCHSNCILNMWVRFPRWWYQWRRAEGEQYTRGCRTRGVVEEETRRSLVLSLSLSLRTPLCSLWVSSSDLPSPPSSLHFIVLMSVPLTAGYCTSQCDSKNLLSIAICVSNKGGREGTRHQCYISVTILCSPS